MLAELAAETLVEEEDLVHREAARIREPRVLAADLQEHFAVDGAHRVLNDERPLLAVLARLAFRWELEVGAVADERDVDRQPKKRAMMAMQTFRSSLSMSANRRMFSCVIAAMTA